MPSIGPLDAEIVLVAESPAQHELMQGIPLVGPSGKLLNKGLVHVGIDRAKCRIINLIPVRAPSDKFANHDPRDVEWAREIFHAEISQLFRAKVFIALGANPLEWLLGGKPPVIQRSKEREDRGFISAWRGSVIPVNAVGFKHTQKPESYLSLIDLVPVPAKGIIVPTFHPSAVLRQFNWHPWFLMDLAKAAAMAKGEPFAYVRQQRKWYRNDPVALQNLANSDVNLISYDTELEPYIVGIATEDEVHVFEWNEGYRRALTKILTNPRILKVAHRWLHDYAFTRKCLEIEIEGPLFDSIGGAMALNGALQKELSPHISTRFTNWPYHKWLSNIDQLHYCGMDAVVCYDAYWPMMRQMMDKGLVNGATLGTKAIMGIVDYDHKLLMPLMQMQAKGFRIDEGERYRVEKELEYQVDTNGVVLTGMVAPIVEKEIKRFKKPHLFQVPRKCECCGGGTKQRNGCQFCSTGKNTEVGSKEFCFLKFEGIEAGFKTLKAYRESWIPCRVCNATGKIIKKLPFNPDSSDQVADVIYRGLKIRPRKFKGHETIKAAQLDPLRDKHPIINAVVALSEVRADYDTVSRLKAGSDGLLHCEFDPWGTESGRVAGKEGLIEFGTNPMNLPKEARRFVIPREGYEFIYPDMAQIEARAMAVLSKDKNLHKALYEIIPDMGKPDYHTWLLRAIHDYDNQINISRDQSKRVSYAGFYGARPEQLAKELTAEAFRKGSGQVVTNEMSTRILQTLYRVCPEVTRWQGYVCDEVLRTRQLISPTGRVFHWVGYISDRKSGELDYEVRKQVWSRLPQDMGAYVLGLGLIDMYYTPNVWGNLLTPLIHVHDALLIEAPIAKVEVAKSLALTTLSRYIWEMDFPAEMSKGSNKGVNWYVVS